MGEHRKRQQAERVLEILGVPASASAVDLVNVWLDVLRAALARDAERRE
jgi:uncharacterized protein YigA (DUF484 family)